MLRREQPIAIPFGAHFFVTYDTFSLLVTTTRDPLGNTTRAEPDYRVLAPSLVTDANLNRTAVQFDALGMVVKTAVMGKEGVNEGDTLEHPTTELQYDLLRWQREQKPAVVHTVAREQHFFGNAASRFQHAFAYSDGFGRIVQQKVQAEPEPGTNTPRWPPFSLLNQTGDPPRRPKPGNGGAAGDHSSRPKDAASRAERIPVPRGLRRSAHCWIWKPS